MNAVTPRLQSVNPNAQALLGDKVILAAVVLSGLAAVLIGFLYFEPMVAIVGALALTGLGVFAFVAMRGTLGSRRDYL